VCPHRVLRRQPAWRRDRAHNPGNAGPLREGQATSGLPEQRALRSPSKRVASKLSPLRLDAEMPGARPGISGRSTASFCLLRGSVEVAEELPVDVVEMVEETAELYAAAVQLAAAALADAAVPPDGSRYAEARSVEAGFEVEAADAGHLAVGADPDVGSQDAAGRGWGAPLAQSVAWARRRLD